MCTSKQKTQVGFGLIELLVALSIVLLLMATIAPLQLDVIDNAGLRKTQQDIIAGLRFSRSRATNSQKIVTFAINAEDGSMTIANKR